MSTKIQANESTAARRRLYFHLVGTDGITPAVAEADGQPQISSNGGTWTDTGIGVLVAIGNGRYYADLTQAAVATVGTTIESRYKSDNTAECPGETAVVVSYDPSINDPLLNEVPGSYASGTAGEALGWIDDVKTKTNNLPTTPAGGDIDGITFASAMECLLAVVCGEATVDTEAGTVAFLKRDGTTTKITVTLGATPGQRTASTIAT